MEPDINNIAARFEGVRPDGHGGYWARCPAHNDRTPSLHISPTHSKAIDEPRILVHCFAGCDCAQNVLPAVGLKVGDLYYKQDRVRRPSEREIDEAIVLLGDIDRAQGKKMSREDRDAWVAAKLRMEGLA